MFTEIINYLQSIEDEKFSHDPIKVRFWEQCFLSAFHDKKSECVPGGKTVNVRKGQFVLIKTTFAGTIGTSVRKLNVCLDYFEKVEKKIYIRKYHRYSIVNVNNFDDIISTYDGKKKSRKSILKTEDPKPKTEKSDTITESVDEDLFPTLPEKKEKKEKKKRKSSFWFDKDGKIQGITEDKILYWMKKGPWSREQVESRIVDCAFSAFEKQDKVTNLVNYFNNWMTPKPQYRDTPATYVARSKWESQTATPSKNGQSRALQGNQISEDMERDIDAILDNSND